MQLAHGFAFAGRHQESASRAPQLGAVGARCYAGGKKWSMAGVGLARKGASLRKTWTPMRDLGQAGQNVARCNPHGYGLHMVLSRETTRRRHRRRTTCRSRHQAKARPHRARRGRATSGQRQAMRDFSRIEARIRMHLRGIETYMELRLMVSPCRQGNRIGRGLDQSPSGWLGMSVG